MFSAKRVLTLVILFISSHIMAQFSGFGIQPKYHFSRHIYVLQDLPKKFARTTDELMSRPGIDLLVDYNLTEKWKVRGKMGYESKGSVTSYYTGVKQTSRYQFNYVAVDLSANRYWGKNNQIQPYNYAGLSIGYLVSQHTDSLPPWAIDGNDPSYPANYDGFSNFNFSYILGVGLSFDNVLWLELERNGDIIPAYQSSQLNVRNVVSSVSVGINLLRLKKKKVDLPQ